MFRRWLALGCSALLALPAWPAVGEAVAGLDSRPKRLLLTFLGDIMAHDVNFHAPDYGAIYHSVRPLLERDSLTFANLETPVDPSRECSTYPLFNVGLEYLAAAAEAGIEVFSLANNHAFDQGPEGVAATLASLEAAGRGSFRRIWYAGIRADLQREFAPVEIPCDGLRIGLLAATQDLNLPLPQAYVLRVDYGRPDEEEAFLSLVRAAAPRYDLLVISYHGGREYAREPEPGRVRFFRRLLAAGADIVWGHHPHVLQDYELVERPEGSGLILYSTGNFISGMTWRIDPFAPQDVRAWTGDSALWSVWVECAGGRSRVTAVRPIPVTNVRDRRGTLVVSTFPGLAAQGLAEPWTGYFRERARQLGESLREWGVVDPR
jgi:poly-gamma-glutamate capsule biosynthesis protein CapA/YwtB (metallophosphatase superfamily)